MNKKFAATHVAAASALALVAGGCVGYFLVAGNSSDSVSVTAKRACPEIDTDDTTAQAFSELASSGSTVNSQLSEKSSGTNTYSYSCSVSVDGKSKLLLTAELTQSGSVETWRKNLAENGDIGTDKDRQTFPVSKKGYGLSSPFSAAVYLECKPTGSTLTGASNLSIEVTLLPRKSDSTSDRANLTRVARSLATHAQSAAHCQNPEKILNGT
jgi:hypothetical protein